MSFCVLNVKAVVGTFNKEKSFSLILKLSEDSFEALINIAVCKTQTLESKKLRGEC